MAKAETLVRVTMGVSTQHAGSRVGAAPPTKVARVSRAPATTLTSFQIALAKAETANAILNKTMVNATIVAGLQQQVNSLCSFAPSTLQVASLLSS